METTTNALVINQEGAEQIKLDYVAVKSAAMTLRAVNFSWKDDITNKENLGLIAQDVEQIIPEFVHEDAEGMKSVNYPQMVSVLIKAVQELSAEVNALKAKLGE